MDKHRERLELLDSTELTSVIFIRDYVQLVFERAENAILTCYTWPEVLNKGMCYRSDTNGYRDVLCSLINETVSSAEAIDGVEIAVTLASGASIRISLRAEDYDGPEAAMLVRGRHMWVW